MCVYNKYNKRVTFFRANLNPLKFLNKCKLLKKVIVLYVREKLKIFKNQKYPVFKLFFGHWYILFILQIT